MENKNATRGILFASLTAMLWGFLAIALKVALREVDPVTVAWFRFASAFLILFTILFLRKREIVGILARPPVLALMAGIGLLGNYVLYIRGVGMTSPSSAQVLIQTAPVILAIIGFTVFRETFTGKNALGLLLVVGGLMTFYWDQLHNLINNSEQNYQLGILAVLGGAASWVIYAVAQKLMTGKYPAQSLNLIIYGLPAILLLPFADLKLLGQQSFGMWVLLIFLGLNTLVAYGSLAEAFRYLESNKIGIIITLNPLITIFTMMALSYFEVSWISPEIVTPLGLLGALLVISGAILAVSSRRKKSVPAMKPKPAT